MWVNWARQYKLNIGHGDLTGRSAKIKQHRLEKGIYLNFSKFRTTLNSIRKCRKHWEYVYSRLFVEIKWNSSTERYSRERWRNKSWLSPISGIKNRQQVPAYLDEFELEFSKPIQWEHRLNSQWNLELQKIRGFRTISRSTKLNWITRWGNAATSK